MFRVFKAVNPSRPCVLALQDTYSKGSFRARLSPAALPERLTDFLSSRSWSCWSTMPGAAACAEIRGCFSASGLCPFSVGFCPSSHSSAEPCRLDLTGNSLLPHGLVLFPKKAPSYSSLDKLSLVSLSSQLPCGPWGTRKGLRRNCCLNSSRLFGEV